MNSPLKELEQIQIRQSEEGYFLNDTEQISKIVNSIKIIAFDNILKKINQRRQSIKVEPSQSNDKNSEQIAQYYRNQYKSIELNEKTTNRKQSIRQKIQEYQQRNSPNNRRKQLPFLRSPNTNYTFNSVLNALATQRQHSILPGEKIAQLNQTMQNVNYQLNNHPISGTRSLSCNYRNKIGQKNRLKKQNNSISSDINQRLQSVQTNQYVQNFNDLNDFTQSTNYRDSQLAKTQIQLGSLTFKIPTCNNFLEKEELRMKKSRQQHRSKPNFLIIDQKYSK